MKRFIFPQIIIAAIAVLTMGLQCEKEYVEPIPIYEFTEKLTLTPYKKVYAINDTIWIQFQTTDKKLFDKLSNSRISTDTTFLQMRLACFRRYSTAVVQDFFSYMKVDNVIDQTFTSKPRYNMLTFSTDCTKNSYFFKIAFVPKTTGVYSIEANGYLADCSSKVRSQSSTFKLTFDLADCNKDVYLSIPSPARGGELGFVDVSIDKKEIFVFKVE